MDNNSVDRKECDAAAKHWKEQGKPPPFCLVLLPQLRLHTPLVFYRSDFPSPALDAHVVLN